MHACSDIELNIVDYTFLLLILFSSFPYIFNKNTFFSLKDFKFLVKGNNNNKNTFCKLEHDVADVNTFLNCL